MNLDYCVPFLLPHYTKNVVALGMQRRFTRITSGMEGFTSQERWDRLGLFSLEAVGDLDSL